VDPPPGVALGVDPLLARGYRDPYRLFLARVVGAPAAPRRRADALVPDQDETSARVEL
jgi:hypothetical protein